MNYAEAYDGYAAQAIPRMDAEIMKKSPFWMETSYSTKSPDTSCDPMALEQNRGRSVLHVNQI